MQYGYGSAASTGYRLVSVTYPNTRVVHYTYGTAGGVSDKLSRLGTISSGSGGTGTIYASYSWNGVGRMVVEDFEEPELRLDYWGQTVDTYAGFDRFGRTTQQLWRDYGNGTDEDGRMRDHSPWKNAVDGILLRGALARFCAKPNRGNRLYRENAHTSTTGKDELYAYNRLNQLTLFHLHIGGHVTY